MVPGLSRVAALWNVQNAGGLGQLREAETAAHALDVTIMSLDIRIPYGLDDAMGQAVQAGAGAVLILSDSSTISNRAQIGASARLHRLPTMFSNKAYLEGGGLMSYGPDIVDSFRLSATHVAKILKGAKPADLPVEQPTEFELVINLKTAKALGLTVPPTMLARADAVIE
jgi:putative ABC transport system substrate-binding protein